MNRFVEVGKHLVKEGVKKIDPNRLEAQRGQFSERQIQRDSDAFFKEASFTVMESQRLGKQTLNFVSQTFTSELEELPDSSQTQEKRERLQTQATLCLDLTNEQEDVRKAAIEKLFQTDEGQEIRREIILQTRENMAGILYENSKERKGRKTYSHQEVVFHMEDVLANIYAASIATLGFFPNEEQLYATIALVNGHNMIAKSVLELPLKKTKEESKGVIADIKTGEGKSAFVAGATAIVQALHNKGVHVATENDYLAGEEAEYAAKLASAMGMTVGLLQESKPEDIYVTEDGFMIQKQLLFIPDEGPIVVAERRDAYSADITCGQRYEFEFDSLHDTLAHKPEHFRQVRLSEDGTRQREWSTEAAYAIIDEADAVLLDQATTPASIEGMGNQEAFTLHNQIYTETDLRMIASYVVGQLTRDMSKDWKENPQGDYVVDHGTATLIDKDYDPSKDQQLRFLGGINKVEALLRTITISPSKGPLLSDDESYYDGKAGQEGLAGIFNRFLYFALQAETLQEGEQTYRLQKDEVIDPGTGQTRNVGTIILLGKHTNRDEPMSRFQYGLSSALEAKHKRIEDAKPNGYDVIVKPESTVFASTTTGAYWSAYKGLSGMTGTANEEMPADSSEQLRKSPAQEYSEYFGGLRVINIPRHKPLQRIDYEAAVGYATIENKFYDLADFIGTFFGADNEFPDLIEEMNNIDRSKEQGRPFLIGLTRRKDIDLLQTIIEEQEWFTNYNLAHPDRPITVQPLSAEDTQEEGRIIARAGTIEHGPVITIASIAGRGTDIRLDKLAKELGGLYVAEGEGARIRTVMQQRGRAGRQGDPGETRQFVSLEDPLFAHAFGEQWVEDQKERLRLPNGRYTTVTAATMREYLQKAQAKLTNEDIDERERLFRDYETVTNQMQPFYSQRKELLFAEPEELPQIVRRLVRDYVRHLIIGNKPTPAFTYPLEETDKAIPNLPMTDEDAVGFIEALEKITYLTKEAQALLFDQATTGKRDLIDVATEICMETYAELEERISPAVHALMRPEARNIQLLSDLKLSEKPLTLSDLLQVQADTKPNLIDVFDARMGPHLTDLLDLREEILHRGSAERLPADSFRLEAYRLYREFKPDLQAQMLRRIFSPQTYLFMANLRLQNWLTLLHPTSVPVLTPHGEIPEDLHAPKKDKKAGIMTVMVNDPVLPK